MIGLPCATLHTHEGACECVPILWKAMHHRRTGRAE